MIAGFLLLAGTLPGANAQTASIPSVVVTPVGPERVLFEGPKQGCDAHDIPDAPLRAFRLAEGGIAAFGLHYENRRLSGPSLFALKIECPVVFRGRHDADPRRFDDRIWLAATWTPDGRSVHALGHAEYHGEAHPGRCSFRENLQCLWISVIGLRSQDGGQSFQRLAQPLVAAPRMKAEEEQGRHRGFFNPTNIVGHEGAHYFMAAQTGATGQPHGVCLFRTFGIAEGNWRAWDGKGFNTTFPSPYTPGFQPQGACKPLAPFPLVPGSITRHRPSGLWVALFPAEKGTPDKRGGTFATTGFYAAASRDLITWSAPTLAWDTAVLGGNFCGADVLRAYPVLMDESAKTRNFEDTGEEALLTFTQIALAGCAVKHQRWIKARKVRITVLRGE